MKTTTFLMFVNEQCGKAKEALNFYTSIFPNSEIRNVEQYSEGEAGGTPELIKRAVFTINETEFMVSENNFEHKFSFTPAISIFIDCDSEDQLKTLFEKLSDGGQVMMPIDNYGFSKKFGWCGDRYGVSWQLNLK